MGLFVLCGCQPSRDDLGYVFEPTSWNKVEKGVGGLKRDEVLETLGTPSCEVSFDQKTLFYIFYTLETKAFFDPTISDLNAVALRFDEKDILRSIESSDKSISIAFDKNATPLPSAHGKDLLKQIFRNLGRFPPLGKKGPKL